MARGERQIKYVRDKIGWGVTWEELMRNRETVWKNTNQGRGGEYSPISLLPRSSHLSGSPPSRQVLTYEHSKVDQCDQSRKPTPLESMYVSYVGARVTLVNCASMKGSAKRSRTMWRFIMKLSEATVAGSTSKCVRKGHEHHQSVV